MATWTEVTPEVLQIAQEIIRDHRPDLVDARIGFLFRSEHSKSGGKIIAGKASKVSDQNKAFMDYDFVIWLAVDVYARGNVNQRRAMIHHELCHLRYDDGECRIVNHDVQEFREVIQTYGAWNIDLLAFEMAKEAYHQASMDALMDQALETIEHKKGGVYPVKPDSMESDDEPTDSHPVE